MAEVKPPDFRTKWSLDTLKIAEKTEGRTATTVEVMRKFLKDQKDQKVKAQDLVSARLAIENIKARVVRHAKGTGLFKIFFGALMGWRAGSKFNKVLSELEKKKKDPDNELVSQCETVKEGDWDKLYNQAIIEDNLRAFGMLREKAKGLGKDYDLKADLKTAAENGSLAIVKKILKEQKRTASSFVREMGLAAEKGHVEVVRAFLKAEVPVDGLHEGKAALHLAAEHGANEVVYTLLEREAKVDLLSGGGRDCAPFSR